jgi:hypothetical protein
MFNPCSGEPGIDSRRTVVASVDFKCGLLHAAVAEVFVTDFLSMAMGEKLRQLRRLSNDFRLFC